LERLFLQGDLMVSERKGMQKTYDIPERVLPKDIDLTMPSPFEFVDYLVKTYLRAYGFTTFKQITHLKTGETIRKNVNEVLHSMLEQGIIQKVEIQGYPTIFIQKDLTEKEIKKSDLNSRILSPFDNSIIHRERIKHFLNFDYRIECYTPKEKRQYGYFCLPILFGNQLIGRVDCKAHRKEKQLEIIHLYIENQNLDIESWAKGFMESMKYFATFNGCESIQLNQVSPSNLINRLKQEM